MKISTKLIVFYVAVLAVFSSLAFALVTELRSVTAGYDALLDTTVQQMDEARIVQVDFKKQVQEWKDILLRGHDPEDLAKYTNQFHEKEEGVAAGGRTLLLQVQDAEAKQLLEQFLAGHAALSQKYQQAYETYVAGNADFKGADHIVRGQDRAPTDLFDKVVQRLEVRVQESVAAQARAARDGRDRVLGAAGGLLLLLGGVGLFLVRDILGRLARLKTISDRLARADLSGLAIDISGHDEISAFGESMKGVHAAIEELLQQVSAQTPVNS